jgi:hypothetical protein
MPDGTDKDISKWASFQMKAREQLTAEGLAPYLKVEK